MKSKFLLYLIANNNKINWGIFTGPSSNVAVLAVKKGMQKSWKKRNLTTTDRWIRID